MPRCGMVARVLRPARGHRVLDVRAGPARADAARRALLRRRGVRRLPRARRHPARPLRRDLARAPRRRADRAHARGGGGVRERGVARRPRAAGGARAGQAQLRRPRQLVAASAHAPRAALRDNPRPGWLFPFPDPIRRRCQRTGCAPTSRRCAPLRADGVADADRAVAEQVGAQAAAVHERRRVRGRGARGGARLAQPASDALHLADREAPPDERVEVDPAGDEVAARGIGADAQLLDTSASTSVSWWPTSTGWRTSRAPRDSGRPRARGRRARPPRLRARSGTPPRRRR